MTNSTLLKKESNAENNAPHSTYTRLWGFFFIVPIERNDEGGKKKTHSQTWNAPSPCGVNTHTSMTINKCLRGTHKGQARGCDRYVLCGATIRLIPNLTRNKFEVRALMGDDWVTKKG